MALQFTFLFYTNRSLESVATDAAFYYDLLFAINN